MYSLVRKCLFQLEPETAHTVALKSLQFAYRLKLLNLFIKQPLQPTTVMGINFPNPIGLAAGLDKNADYVDALAALGFGFIEIGTVTPKPQIGNPPPRLFRLAEQQTLINRMGFNNKGVDYVVTQLAKIRYRGILGINIGKNKHTPNEQAVDDYLYCLRHLWPFASYITINISSPNTLGLRELQQPELLSHLLSSLKKQQKIIADEKQKYLPLVVKISPDLSEPELQQLAAVLLQQQVDGVIATNTSTQRPSILPTSFAKETGGLSGKPLQPYSTQTIKQLYHLLQNKIPIIACGGIMDITSAQEKLAAGASLLQIYTGLIYQGPGIIKKLMDFF